MREAYRLNRGRFPAHGSLLFLVRRCDDEQLLVQEMFQLAAAVVSKAGGDSSGDM